MYMIHPRIVRPFPCIRKTCGVYFHPSMTIGNFYHNPHFHVDGLVVLQILPNLDPLDLCPSVIAQWSKDNGTRMDMLSHCCRSVI